jgi:hypothetical protein
MKNAYPVVNISCGIQELRPRELFGKDLTDFTFFPTHMSGVTIESRGYRLLILHDGVDDDFVTRARRTGFDQK